MKVLHVISGDLWAGAEAQAATLLGELVRQPGVQLSVVVLNPGELEARLRAAGIDVMVLDESQHSALVILWRLLRVMRRLQPHIVHTHRFKENILGAVAARLVTKAACVRTEHGAPEHPTAGLRHLPRRLLLALDGWCGRHVQAACIAVSGALGRQLRDARAGFNVVVIENGVAPPPVPASVPAWKREAPGALHVGIAGRLVPVKRVDLFLQLAADLLRDPGDVQWRWHVFGDGPLRPALQAQHAALGLGGAVTFHGQCPDMAAQLAHLDVLVMCSDHEGMPMVALEAVAAGTPVLAHAVGGLVELLPPLLQVLPNQPAAYAQRLRQLLAARGSSAAPLAQVALPQAATAAHNAQRVLQLYRDLAGTAADL